MMGFWFFHFHLFSHDYEGLCSYGILWGWPGALHRKHITRLYFHNIILFENIIGSNSHTSDHVPGKTPSL